MGFDRTALCNEDTYCYVNWWDVGECVDSCVKYPNLTDERCNCNNNNTCMEHEACISDQAKCGIYPDCEDLSIVSSDHCACIEAMLACNETEYCYFEKRACLPAPPACPDAPSLAPAIGCSCNGITICLEGLMCDNVTATCLERPDPCLDMPIAAGVDKCYCADAHEICEDGFMCNLYNSSCSLPPPLCGQIPDIATEARCVCENKSPASADNDTPASADRDTPDPVDNDTNDPADNDTPDPADNETPALAAKICEEGEMCDSKSVTCEKRPDDCPVMPDLSLRGGCYCEVNHTLCIEDEMCDNRTTVAGCTPRPPECPPMPGVTYGVIGCYCRFSDSICEAVHMCNERNNSCSIPAMCPDPTSVLDWPELNLDIMSDYNETTLIEGVNITIMCKENTFLIEKVIQCLMNIHLIQKNTAKRDMSGPRVHQSHMAIDFLTTVRW